VPSPLRHVPVLRWRWVLPAALLLLGFHVSPFGAALDRAFFDLASRHPMRRAEPPPNSALVFVDEDTLETLKKIDSGMRWPLPRYAWAGFIAALHRAGAAKIVFDFTFFERDARDEFDLILANVAAAVPSVVLGRTEKRTPVFWDSAFIARNAALFPNSRMGNVDFLPDDDGLVRHYEMPGSLTALAFDPAPTSGGGLLHWHGGLADIQARGTVPVLSAARFIVRGNEIIRRLIKASPNLTVEEFARALAQEPQLTDDPAFAAVRGRTVFVGANAAATYDVKPTPVGKFEPGTLIHWTAWANLVSDDFITPWPRSTALAVALLGGVVIVGVGLARPGLLIPVFAALGFSAVVFGTAYAGLSAGWFLPPATPMLGAMLTLLGVAAESFWTEQRRKREIQAMFGSYVDPAVVALLVRDPGAIRLGGERRKATVFFSDLAGFTDLSEKIPPEQLLDVINLYLQEMSDCVLAHHAYVDKYIGDAVMAVFGAPQPTSDHAIDACRSAIAARGVLERINAQLAQTYGHRLTMRIGINTGEMIVGNLGSERKRNYTVLGDAVNLASRLEAANKEFGTDILLGETTARGVADHFATRPLTRLRVKGKLEAIEVHELLASHADLTPAQRDFLTPYLAGYSRYATRQFAGAVEFFQRALAARPADRVTAELLRTSVAFVQAPPPADWEPIVTLETK
jgi:adenylate cyclase